MNVVGYVGLKEGARPRMRERVQRTVINGFRENKHGMGTELNVERRARWWTVTKAQTFDRRRIPASAVRPVSKYCFQASHQFVPSIIVLPSPRTIPSKYKNLNNPFNTSCRPLNEQHPPILSNPSSMPWPTTQELLESTSPRIPLLPPSNIHILPMLSWNCSKNDRRHSSNIATEIGG